MRFHSFFATAAIALLSLTPAHAAKKKAIDFSPFAGTYHGSYLINDGNNNFTGNITILASAPQHGKKLTVKISGLVAGSGQNYPVSGSFTLNQKKVSSDSLIMGLTGAPIATLTSTFSGKKKTFAFTLMAAPGAQFIGGPISGALSYTLQFGKKSVAISGFGTLTTGSTFSTFVQIAATKTGK